MKNLFLLVLPLSVILGSCSEAVSEGYQQSYSASLSTTMSRFEKKIDEGLTRQDVKQRIGEPTIIAKDELGRDVWIYEQNVRIEDIGDYFENDNGPIADIKNQTLTLNVKFDRNGKVRQWTNHVSHF